MDEASKGALILLPGVAGVLTAIAGLSYGFYEVWLTAPNGMRGIMVAGVGCLMAAISLMAFISRGKAKSP